MAQVILYDSTGVGATCPVFPIEGIEKIVGRRLVPQKGGRAEKSEIDAGQGTLRLDY